MRGLTTENTEGTEANLRDWFAVNALPALIQKDTEHEKWALLRDKAEPSAREYDRDGSLICAVPYVMQPCDLDNFWEGVARASYEVADAMLIARKIKSQEGNK